MLTLDDDRHGNVNQTVTAFIDIVGLTLIEAGRQHGVAFMAPGRGARMDTVEPCADILPTGGDEDVSLKIKDSGHGTSQGGEFLANPLQVGDR
ncbi:hypothetical protein M2352_002065 [Azospirillum fermentarium]|nr:hypothetical protein [Azospirillum fermentarium]